MKLPMNNAGYEYCRNSTLHTIFVLENCKFHFNQAKL